MSTILITGGTGLLGLNMAKLLAAKGHTVNLLSRSNKAVQPYSKVFVWDVEAGMMDEEALKECDYIINLAGEGIADGAWTAERKRRIVDSRVKSANLLYAKLKSTPNTVKAFISASAIGYYGMVTIPGKVFVETDPAGEDFLAQCCIAWENAAHQMESLNIRTVRVRIGVVMSTKDAALAKITGLAKFGPVAAVGTGKQAMPWIHLDDVCNIFIHAMEHEDMHGPYNAVAPAHDDNISFTKAIGKQIHRPMLPFPVPAFGIRLMYGEMAVVVLEGTEVSPQKVINAGFQFQHTDLGETLKDLYDRGI